MRRLFACALLAVVVSPLGLAACRGAEEAAPVATPGFSASKTRLPLGSPVDLTYSFDVAQDAKISGDYRVFVHFLDSEGQQMWTDDHDPAIPTSQWKPGQKVQYTRTVFMPIFPYQGPATVTLGLYNGPTLDDRLPMNGDGKGREYKVGTLELLPQSENVYLAFREGWHALEMAPEDPAREWQWMRKTGTLAFRNPKKDVTLYLEIDGRPDLYPGAPQVVTLFVNGAQAHQFKIDQKLPVLHRFPLTAAQLGAGETVEVKLEADKAFVPAQMPGAGGDPRELSMRVYHAFVEPK